MKKLKTFKLKNLWTNLKKMLKKKKKFNKKYFNKINLKGKDDKIINIVDD